MFYNCTSLYSIPDISKWETKNMQNIELMFSNCSSLISLPDLSKWDTNNLKNMKGLLSDCISLSLCPDITKWNNFNIKDINLTPNYKELEKSNNINFEYTTFINPNEGENYDELFNNIGFLSNLREEKFKRIFN